MRIRLRSTAVRIEHNAEPSKSDFVWVTYAHGGKTYRLKALSVIMTGGCWVIPYVVHDLPQAHREACAQFHRSECSGGQRSRAKLEIPLQAGDFRGALVRGFG